MRLVKYLLWVTYHTLIIITVEHGSSVTRAYSFGRSRNGRQPSVLLTFRKI